MGHNKTIHMHARPQAIDRDWSAAGLQLRRLQPTSGTGANCALESISIERLHAGTRSMHVQVTRGRSSSEPLHVQLQLSCHRAGFSCADLMLDLRAGCSPDPDDQSTRTCTDCARSRSACRCECPCVQATCPGNVRCFCHCLCSNSRDRFVPVMLSEFLLLDRFPLEESEGGGRSRGQACTAGHSSADDTRAHRCMGSAVAVSAVHDRSARCSISNVDCCAVGRGAAVCTGRMTRRRRRKEGEE